MAVEWGGWSGHMRVGIDVWTDGYDTWTPSINVYVAVWVQCDPSWNFGDNQHVSLTGNVGGEWDFYNNLGANQTRHIGTATIYGQGQNYNGGPDYWFQAVLSGNYLGVNSSHARGFRLPARPKRAPAPPSSAPNWTNVTPTSATLTWGGTTDAGGGTPVEDNLQASANSSFTALIHDTYAPGSSRTVSGMAPGTRYWFRARVRNEIGWSGWSGTSEGVTPSFGTEAPTVTEIGPDSARANWGAPSGATATRYEVQVARDSGFTNSVQTISSTTWGTSRVLTGLAPASRYWVRVRSGTSTGWGAWSGGTSFETLSGAKIRRGGAWIDAPAYVRKNGAWVSCKVYKRKNGVWTI